MTTFEHWQRQLTPYLRGGQESETQTTTAQTTADLEGTSGLRHNLSKLKLSNPFSLPSKTTPDTAQPVQLPNQQATLNSGYVAAPTSAPTSQDETHGLTLPGTDLRYFDKPIPERLKARFFDIKVLYTQPLLDAISKGRKDPGDISMKLRYMGICSRDIEPHIVIQCERKVAKRVKRFFTQGHVEEELLPDFRVLVLTKTLLRLANDDVVEVLSDSIPEGTMCGMPIELSRGGRSVNCTLGGVIMVEGPPKRLYGLMAGHPLRRLHVSSSDSHPTTEASGSSSEEECHCSDSDSVATFDICSKSRDPDTEEQHDKFGQPRLAIGTVTHDSFSTSVKNNYDWAIIDLDTGYALPNLVTPQSYASYFGETEVEIQSYHHSSHEELPAKEVLILREGQPLMAELSFNTSSLMMFPGSSFVDVHEMAMRDGPSLRPGDSGSWVVDAKTSRLYGHVVSVDVFGEAQVIPIHTTLQSIREQLKAKQVYLPQSQDIDRLKATLKQPSLSIPPRSTGTESEPIFAPTEHPVKERSNAIFPPTERLERISSRAIGASQDGPDITSDVDTLDALACDLYITSLVLQARHGDPALSDICAELRYLHRSLGHLRTEALDQESILHRQLFTMDIHLSLQSFHLTLKEALDALSSHCSGGAAVQSDETGALWGNKKLRLVSVKTEIASTKARIETFLDTIQLEKVEKIANCLFMDESIQPYWGDRDDLWERFQACLQDEGFSPTFLRKNRGIIRAYVRVEIAAATKEDPKAIVRRLLKRSEITLPVESLGLNYGKKPNEESERVKVVWTHDLVALDDADQLIAHRFLSPGAASGPMKSPPPYTENRNRNSSHISDSGLLLPSAISFRNYDDFEWTMIVRELISIVVLEQAGLRYEARPHYVAVVGILSAEKVDELIHESKIELAARISKVETDGGLEDQEAEASGEHMTTRSYDNKGDAHLASEASGKSKFEIPIDGGLATLDSYNDKSSPDNKRVSRRKIHGSHRDKSSRLRGDPREWQYEKSRGERRRKGADMTGGQQSVQAGEKDRRQIRVAIWASIAATSLLSTLAEAAESL
ncbi:hypothetical protein ACLX1H_006070 [Fusarium chlamydosporum]